jgi:methyl-accepting chemotaxis protein
VGTVDAGTKLVEAAGSTMHEVVDSVKRVTVIMGEITAASQEQSSGVAAQPKPRSAVASDPKDEWEEF